MLHQILFLVIYLGLLPTVLVSPFAGVLMYKWLEDLPPDRVYSATLLPVDLSFVVGVLTFLLWLVRERKAIPRPSVLFFALVALLIWINITSLWALAPAAAAFKWDRTVKVIGFAILTAQMLRTRARLEGLIWVLVLTVAYFAVPGAIKTIVSGGAGALARGKVVVAAPGSFFGDRVTFSVVLSMVLPFTLYLRRQARLIPASPWLKRGLLATAAALVIAMIGTYARTALLAGGVTFIMLAGNSRNRLAGLLILVAVVLAVYLVVPADWFARMGTIAHYRHNASAENRLIAWGWAWRMALAHPILGGGFRVFVLDHGITAGSGYIEAHNIFFEMMAEQGFVGLGLFCLILLLIYRSCRVVSKRVEGLDGLAWAADLAYTVQIGLVAYVVGGMFVSIATSPFLYNLAGLAIGLRGLVERELRAASRQPAYGPDTVALQPARQA